MIITSERNAGVLFLTVAGRLDSVTAPGFGAQSQPHLQAAGLVVLDGAELDYISSAGLRVLMELGRQLQSTGSRLAFCALKGPVQHVMEMSGFAMIYPVFASREAVLESQ